MVQTVVTTIAGAVLTALAGALVVWARRRLFPPVGPGDRAPAYVVRPWRRVRRAKVWATGSGALRVAMRGKPPLDIPYDAVCHPTAPTAKDRRKVHAHYTVVLEWSAWRVFLRVEDWPGLSRAAFRAPPVPDVAGPDLSR